MIVHGCPQGSEEWLRLRLGRPTASAADRILTPAKLQPSTQAAKYRNQLVAEWLYDQPIDWSAKSQFMDRGTALEPEGRALYALKHDVDVELVGFAEREDINFGGSPDGLVGVDGVLEVKCLALDNHIGAMLSPDGFAADHRGQVQALLYVTDRAWADLYAYHPELPPVLFRIERDDAYQRALHDALAAFCRDLQAAKAKLAPHRLVSHAEAMARYREEAA